MKNPLERFKKFVKKSRPILLGTAFLGLSAFFMFYMSLNPSSKKNHVVCTGSTAVESSILNKDSLDPSEKTANSGVTITENKQDHFGGATKQPSKSDCDQSEELEQEKDQDSQQDNNDYHYTQDEQNDDEDEEDYYDARDEQEDEESKQSQEERIELDPYGNPLPSRLEGTSCS